MERLFILVLLALALAVAGCGTDATGTKDAVDGSTKDGVDGKIHIKGDAIGDSGVDGTPDPGDQVDLLDTSPDNAPEACENGLRSCASDKEVAECQLGKWVVVSVCPDTHFCAAGTCIESESCTPGEISGCYSYDALKQCNLDGTGYIPFACPEGEKCANGKCGEFECSPGQAKCLDNGVKQVCSVDGYWMDPEPCPQGLLCVGGKCLSECLSDPKWNNSYIGCEYWSLDLDNYHDPFSSTKPDEALHGVMLGNPGTAAATVTFTSFASDVDFAVQPVVVQPGDVEVVELPRMDIDGQVITDRSVRINSNRPVVAYQFNPLDFQKAYSDDSSLLIPAEMLGKEYFVLSYPTSPLEAAPLGDFESQHGYFTVLAVEEGETKVSVRVSAVADKPGAPEGEFLTPGGYHEFIVQQGQVINFQGDGSTFMKANDLSGSHIIADRKVAVFTGHEEAVVQAPGLDCCCAEHLEEQLFPLDTWASEYVCAKARSRGGSGDQDLWRILAGAGNTTITTIPPIAGLDGQTLAAKGDWIEAMTAESFVVDASGPIQVAQYLSSQTCTDDGVGDPALIMAVASIQFRHNYVFAAPKDYDEDYVTVVREAGSPITLDGALLGDGEFVPVGSGFYEVGYFEVQDGPHQIEGDKPFGLYQYGFDGPASYGNPGGLNLIKQQ